MKRASPNLNLYWAGNQNKLNKQTTYPESNCLNITWIKRQRRSLTCRPKLPLRKASTNLFKLRIITNSNSKKWSKFKRVRCQERLWIAHNLSWRNIETCLIKGIKRCPVLVMVWWTPPPPSKINNRITDNKLGIKRRVDMYRRRIIMLSMKTTI